MQDEFAGARHLTLVDRRYLHELSKIEAGMVHHYAAELSLCNEFDPGPEPEGGWPPDKAQYYPQLHRVWSQLREWLYVIMEMKVSVNARGRDDLVSIFTASEEERAHPDSGEDPPSARRVRGPKELAKASSKAAAKVGSIGLK